MVDRRSYRLGERGRRRRRPDLRLDAAVRLGRGRRSALRALDKPWVADLGDPWALDEMMIYPTALHRRRELRRMRSAARHGVRDRDEHARGGARLWPTSPSSATGPSSRSPTVSTRPTSRASRAPARREVPHRPHRLPPHRPGPAARRSAAARRALGGASRGVDILTRSHVYLVEAINRLLARDPYLADVLELHLAGVTERGRPGGRRRMPGRDAPRLHVARRVDRAHAHRGAALSADAEPPGRECGRRSCPVRPTSTSRPARRSSAAVPEGDARDILQRGRARDARPAGRRRGHGRARSSGSSSDSVGRACLRARRRAVVAASSTRKLAADLAASRARRRRRKIDPRVQQAVRTSR